ncbi:MAG TPA: oligosaccharide flippase family protein, partial [Fimbriimonas sp.]|nr:oligosaccharide flippase family protein [Fimbriimonas sp.]
AAVMMIYVRGLWQVIDFGIPSGINQVLSSTFRVDPELGWEKFRAGSFLTIMYALLGLVGLSLGAVYLRTPDLLKRDDMVLLSVLAGAIFFTDQIGNGLNAPFNVRGQFVTLAKLTFFIPLASVLTGLILVVFWRSPAAMLLSMALESVALLALKGHYLAKHDGLKNILPKYNPDHCRDIMKMSFRSFIPDLSSKIGAVADKVIVGAVLGNEKLAIYNLAQRIPSILLESFNRVSEAITPEMTHAAKNEPEKLKSIFLRNFGFVGAIAGAGILFVSGFGSIIEWSWLNRHRDQFGLAVFLLGIYSAFELHHSTITRVFFARGLAHLMLPFSLVNSLTTIFVTAWAAQNYGFIGVATMNCLIDVVQIIPIHIYCVKYGVPGLKFSEIFRITAITMGTSTVASFCVMMFLKPLNSRWASAGLLLLAPIGCVLLIAMFWRLKGIELPGPVERRLRKIAPLRKLFGLSPQPASE